MLLHYRPAKQYNAIINNNNNNDQTMCILIQSVKNSRKKNKNKNDNVSQIKYLIVLEILIYISI